jgi:hypothetical protein
MLSTVKNTQEEERKSGHRYKRKNLCEDGNKRERLGEQQSQPGAGQTVKKIIKTVLAVTDLNWTDPKVSLCLLH